jgi:hypothetical protein
MNEFYIIISIIGGISILVTYLWSFFKLLGKIEQKVSIVEFNAVKFQVEQLSKEAVESKNYIQILLSKIEALTLQLNRIESNYTHINEILHEIKEDLRMKA